MIPFLRVGDIMHCTIFFFPLLPKCVLALYTALKQYNLQVALCVVNISAIKKMQWVDIEWEEKRKITLFITVHFSLQVVVLSNAVFKFLNCFVSLKNDNERILIEQIAFRS